MVANLMCVAAIGAALTLWVNALAPRQRKPYHKRRKAARRGRK